MIIRCFSDISVLCVYMFAWESCVVQYTYEEFVELLLTSHIHTSSKESDSGLTWQAPLSTEATAMCFCCCFVCLFLYKGHFKWSTVKKNCPILPSHLSSKCHHIKSVCNSYFIQNMVFKISVLLDISTFLQLTFKSIVLWADLHSF